MDKAVHASVYVYTSTYKEPPKHTSVSKFIFSVQKYNLNESQYFCCNAGLISLYWFALKPSLDLKKKIILCELNFSTCCPSES